MILLSDPALHPAMDMDRYTGGRKIKLNDRNAFESFETESGIISFIPYQTYSKESVRIDLTQGAKLCSTGPSCIEIRVSRVIRNILQTFLLPLVSSKSEIVPAAVTRKILPRL